MSMAKIWLNYQFMLQWESMRNSLSGKKEMRLVSGSLHEVGYVKGGKFVPSKIPLLLGKAATKLNWLMKMTTESALNKEFKLNLILIIIRNVHGLCPNLMWCQAAKMHIKRRIHGSIWYCYKVLCLVVHNTDHCLEFVLCHPRNHGKETPLWK